MATLPIVDIEIDAAGRGTVTVDGKPMENIVTGIDIVVRARKPSKVTLHLSPLFVHLKAPTMIRALLPEGVELSPEE